jgi:hypothetical protein
VLDCTAVTAAIDPDHGDHDHGDHDHDDDDHGDDDADVGGYVVPDYAGANVRGIVPALLGPRSWTDGLPDWMPTVVADASAVVLFVLDGLGWHQLRDRLELVPALAGMRSQRIDTVAPTTTATALTSIATGLTPGEHGVIGYRMVLGRDVLNVLRWTVDDQPARRMHPPRVVQPVDAFVGRDVAVVSPAELQSSAFSEAHLHGARAAGWRAPSSIPLIARDEVLAGARFVYCYYGGIDKIAHERGFGEFYDHELRAADWLVAEMLDRLPSGTVLLVTADHGQVDVGSNIVHPSPELLRGVTFQSGEGRFRWLHTASGAAADVEATARAEVGDVAWVVTVDRMLDEGWFGPSVAAPIRRRLGDVALVARDDVSFHADDDTGPFELRCRHGSLTPAEVHVPLLSAVAG